MRLLDPVNSDQSRKAKSCFKNVTVRDFAAAARATFIFTKIVHIWKVGDTNPESWWTHKKVLQIVEYISTFMSVYFDQEQHAVPH